MYRQTATLAGESGISISEYVSLLHLTRYEEEDMLVPTGGVSSLDKVPARDKEPRYYYTTAFIDVRRDEVLKGEIYKVYLVEIS